MKQQDHLAVAEFSHPGLTRFTPEALCVIDRDDSIGAIAGEHVPYAVAGCDRRTVASTWQVREQTLTTGGGIDFEPKQPR